MSYGCMIVSCFTWVTAYIYSNEHSIHPIQTSFIRGFMIMLASFLLCIYNKDSLNVRVSWREINIRNFIFLVQGFIMSAVQFYLPLNVIHTFASIGPALVCIYQYFLDGKKLNKKQITGILFTLFGVIVTTNGRLLTKIFDPLYEF